MLHCHDIPRELLMLERPFTAEEKAQNRERTEGIGEREIQRALYGRYRSASLFVLPNYTPRRWYEADLFVVTRAGYAIEFEIKTTFADFKADFGKPNKHRRLAGECGTPVGRPSRFFFAVPEMLVSPRDVPDHAGLVYFRRACTGHDFLRHHIVRDAPRLTDEKVPAAVLAHMRSVTYYRFWNERRAFDNYRRRMEQRVP